MTREWSKYQQAIFDEVENGRGHLGVVARAGSGKSTTIEECVRRLPRGTKTLVAAFGRDIAAAMKARLPRAVDVRTLHSLGLLAVKRAFPNVVVDEDKGRKIATAILKTEPRARGPRGAPKAGEVTRLSKLVELAKNMLLESPVELEDAAISFDLDEGLVPLPMLVECARRCLNSAESDTETVDPTDMVWFPAKFQLKFPRYEFAFVDEVQDMNPAQLYEVVQAGKDGRIVAVGDDRQAVYAWRGADAVAMQKTFRQLEATVLPLSITYRCPKAVVALAKTIVPDFEASPEAEEGRVAEVKEFELVRGAQPGDFVLARKNAALVKVCMMLLRSRRPACIAGRDIGRALVTLAERFDVHGVPDMLRALSEYRALQFERLMDAGKEQKAEELGDTCEALSVIAEGHRTVPEVIRAIDEMFEDDDPLSKIVCSTPHRAKGLERDRVWMLTASYARGKSVEEDNLIYVSWTRAKKELFLVQ